MVRGGYLILAYDLKRAIADARGYHCDNVAKRKLQNTMSMKIWQRESRGVAVLASR
jgi:hypothetical protein